MRKLIILLLCCGMLVSMVGWGGDTASPPTESLTTTVSESVITETPAEITPQITTVEPTGLRRNSTSANIITPVS